MNAVWILFSCTVLAAALAAPRLALAARGLGCAVAAVAGCSLVTWGYVYAWGSAHRAGEFTLTADHQEALGWGLWLANGQTLVAAAVLLTAVTYRTLQRAAAKPPAAA